MRNFVKIMDSLKAFYYALLIIIALLALIFSIYTTLNGYWYISVGVIALTAFFEWIIITNKKDNEI